MELIKVGDAVSRKSHGSDVIFAVLRILTGPARRSIAVLKGLNARLVADAPLTDLVRVREKDIESAREQVHRLSRESLEKVFLRRMAEELSATGFRGRAADALLPGVNYGKMPGRVLHLDGDGDYLGNCMRYYRELGVPAVGEHVPEEAQADKVVPLIRAHLPDILVLTGHDGLIARRGDRTKLENYRTSRFFVEAVRRARQVEPDKDALVIVAGACQSHYEAIVEAGANFASSPERVFIHCYDPILVAEKVAFTPFDSVVYVSHAIENTVSGIKGIGGIETKGKLRLSLPDTASRITTESA
ncbi:MAG: sporulation peptidase YabG [Betaproteobacteria bacterium]